MLSLRLAVPIFAVLAVHACASMDQVSDSVAEKLVLDPQDGPAAKQAAFCWSATIDQQQRAGGSADFLAAINASKDYWGRTLGRLSPVDGGPQALIRSAGMAYDERINGVPGDQRSAKADEIFAECRSLQLAAESSNG